jgi:phosphoglycolate phosphatase
VPLHLGLEITAEEVFSSSFAAAAYLDSIDFPKVRLQYTLKRS